MARLDRARPGVGTLRDAGICGGQPYPGGEAWAYFVPTHFAERAGRGDRVSDADGARDHALRIVFELSRLGDPAADGQLGFADCGRCGRDQYDQDLLVVAGISRGVPGRYAAGVEFFGGWVEGCVGCERG